MRRLLVLVFLVGCVTAAPEPADPYEVLRRAYAQRDAALAASAYAPGAEVVYRYDGLPERHRGRAAIQRSFENFFATVDGALDLNFRRLDDADDREQGYYRLRYGRGGYAYGAFTARRDPATGLFAYDESGAATALDFETVPGPVMFDAAEDELDRAFYGSHVGRYRLPDGCELVVTQSIVRLFVRDTCTRSWRGLRRNSADSWFGGETVISRDGIYHYRFVRNDATILRLEVHREGRSKVAANRIERYRIEPLSFRSPDGTWLAGDLYRPRPHATGRATVLVHGSGPQDRNGYASIIAVLADAFATRGDTVLTFDKRGTGGSAGATGLAGFAALAGDAVAAMQYLRGLDGVDAARVGLAGSSQAGWVVAAALAAGAEVSHVALLGAAGAALTVEEQNLYNTGVRMRCAGFDEKDVDLALRQQRAFFDFVQDRAPAEALDELTDAAQRVTGLADWLFPRSDAIDRDADAWFTVLDLDFDPLPLWATYEGPARFVFAGFDDATPTQVAVARLSALAASQGSLTLRVLDNAQHIGLEAYSLCHSGLGEVSKFAPGLFEALTGESVTDGRG